MYDITPDDFTAIGRGIKSFKLVTPEGIKEFYQKIADVPVTVKERQKILDEVWEASNPHRTSFKILCRHCGKGPNDGVALKRVGWSWSCMQHKLRRRM